ncbi:hypothetical protein [Spirosoma daeguense]
MKHLCFLALLGLISFTTSAQISLVKEFRPCCDIGAFQSMDSYFLLNANGGLWRSDGTTAGTISIGGGELPSPNLRCQIGNTLTYTWAHLMDALAQIASLY